MLFKKGDKVISISRHPIVGYITNFSGSRYHVKTAMVDIKTIQNSYACVPVRDLQRYKDVKKLQLEPIKRSLNFIRKEKLRFIRKGEAK